MLYFKCVLQSHSFSKLYYFSRQKVLFYFSADGPYYASSGY
jgi:hypothetical protein